MVIVVERFGRARYAVKAVVATAITAWLLGLSVGALLGATWRMP